MDFKSTTIAVMLGVLLAGVIMMVVSLGFHNLVFLRFFFCKGGRL